MKRSHIALGDAMAVNVMRWLGIRIEMVEATEGVMLPMEAHSDTQ